MFDLTKEIKLDKKKYTLYRKLQIILYLGAFLLSFYLAYLIIFPHLFFTFSFQNPNSSKNTITRVKLADDTLFFNANFSGDYSSAKINLIKKKESVDLTSFEVSTRKSYQAFLYPEGDPLGFKNGSLLENNGDYYIVSKEKFRKFSNLDVLLSLGYKKESFKKIANTDLDYNLSGPDITSHNQYFDSMFFRIDDDYYVLENQILKKFVSDQAFLSGYDQSQAVEKNIDFLKNFPISDELKGFSNGTLISHDISAYIVSGNEILPINNTQTFESKGFDWNDVMRAGSDEIAIYTKGKLFTIDSPHPDGSIFKSKEDSKYHIILNGKKHLLPTENIALSYLKKNPVYVSKKSLNVKEKCNLKKSFLSFNSYSCDIPLDVFENIIGTSYEFSFEPKQETNLSVINVDFKRNVSFKNFKTFFSEIFTRIKQNYVPTSTN